VKHILVTGGAGFIGSHLVEALLSRDYHVTVLDDESTGSPENLAAVRDHFNLQYVTGSAADKRIVRRLVDKADEVYHLADSAGVEMLAVAPIHALETNLYPTELLLNELLKRHRQGHTIKFFLASSSQVYGRNPRPRWSEDDELHFGPCTRGRWSLGLSKATAESLALAYWRQHRLPVVVGRLFNIAGPRQSGLYGAVIPRFVSAALTGRPLVVHDDGQQVRCFAHVCDIVRAMIGLVELDAAAGHVFNLGSDQPLTILQLAQRIIAASRRKVEIEFRPYGTAVGREDFEEVRSRIPDLGRLRQALGYMPEFDLDDIIRDVLEERASGGA
jgi:UDP-glucose 4-epimerase